MQYTSVVDAQAESLSEAEIQYVYKEELDLPYSASYI